MAAWRPWTAVHAIWDNYKAYNITLPETVKDVVIELLPPNRTAENQPLDQGCIAAFKKINRYKLLESYDSIINDWAAVRELGKLKPPGARGLIYGYVANINDACEIARSCWDTADAGARKVSSDTIVNCVIKALARGCGQ